MEGPPSSDLAHPLAVAFDDVRDDGPSFRARLRLVPWAVFSRLTTVGRPRVAVHPAVPERAVAEALSIQRGLFAVRAFGVVLVAGILLLQPQVERLPYIGGV